MNISFCDKDRGHEGTAKGGTRLLQGGARSPSAILAIATFLLLLATTTAAQTPPSVVTATARAEMLAPTRELIGTIVPARESVLAAPVGARLVSIKDTGTRVAKGDVVATLDVAELELALQRERARLTRLKAEQALAARQRDRLNALRDAVPAAQRDEAHARFEVLAAEIAEARVALELTELRVRDSSLRAPFAGTIVAELKQPGEQVQSGEGVVRLMDTGDTEVDVAVPVDWATGSNSGASVRVDASTGFASAELQSLVPGDADTRQLRARLKLKNILAPIGASVRVAWPSAAPVVAVTVPGDALIQRDEGYYVLRVDGDIARRIDVEPSTRVADRVAVIGAIGPGDEIIIRGGERLADGDKLQVLREALVGAALCAGASC